MVDLAAGVGLDLVVNAPPDLRDLPAAVEEAAWAIATEAMTNVVRHAGATQCAVALDIGDALSLVVRDDGRGLPPRIVPGIGVHSMRQRTHELGGTFTIRTRPGGGTEVSASLPLASS